MKIDEKQLEKRITNGLTYVRGSKDKQSDRETDSDIALQIYLAKMEKATTSDFQRYNQLQQDIEELEEVKDELKSLSLEGVYNSPESIGKLLLMRRWIKKERPQLPIGSIPLEGLLSIKEINNIIDYSGFREKSYGFYPSKENKGLYSLLQNKPY